MLDTIMNDMRDRLGYLYFVYRVTSFDVYRKSLKVFLDQIFETNTKFPILDINKVFNLIASEYLEI